MCDGNKLLTPLVSAGGAAVTVCTSEVVREVKALSGMLVVKLGVGLSIGAEVVVEVVQGGIALEASGRGIDERAAGLA